jgi:hypothetical protein
MPTKKPKPPRPTDLTEAREAPEGEEDRDAHGYCHEISCYAGRDDYHWRFRVYRTAYAPSCSDGDFHQAIKVLQEYMRYACFKEIGYDGSGNITNASNDKPEQQLWKRLRNDISQDQALLDGASTAGIKSLAKE